MGDAVMIYTVEYLEYFSSNVKSIEVNAKNKIDAYDTAVYKVLDTIPYSAWVSKVTYKNGSSRSFNTFSGKPY